ncbi:MAG: hypothetical protein P8J20_16460, partial [Novosphingobium sp.]|nr:hypothetical protein [Novosphingobium sp.]
NTASSPPNINQPDEANAPLIYAPISAKWSDDGHLQEKRPGQWQATSEVTVEIEGEDKPALIADWIIMMFI